MRASFVWFAIVTCGFAAETGATDPKLLWTGPGVNLLGGPSRDGKILSYVDPATRNLSIREFSTGQTRTLTHQQGGEFAYFSSISRDSRKVAYAWFNSAGFYELRVIGADGRRSPASSSATRKPDLSSPAPGRRTTVTFSPCSSAKTTAVRSRSSPLTADLRKSCAP